MSFSPHPISLASSVLNDLSNDNDNAILSIAAKMTPYDNAILAMASSGTKGNAFSSTQMSGLLGQQSVRGHRKLPESIALPTSSTQNENSIINESFETLMKSLYGISVEIPQFLIINGLRVNFISFNQSVDMLSRKQIERFIINPLLQPWAGAPGTPNRIITLFGQNGITYLVKARLDPQLNQLFAPV
jgi:hypothetical protein